MTDNPDPDSTGEKIGALIAGFLAHAANGLSKPFIGFWKRMKGGATIAESLLVAGYKIRLRRKGDVIVNVIYEDGIVKPRAAQYNSDGPYFETDNDEKFYAGGLGYSPKRIAGKVPVVWAMSIGSEITEPLEAPIAQARRLGQDAQVERHDGKEDIAVELDPNQSAQSAMADGGLPAMNGWAVSWREAFELFGSKVTNEELNQQEERGFLAAMNFRRGDTWKWLLAVLGAFALGLFGPSLAASIAGGAASGGGGGGLSSLPLLLGVGI